MISDKELWDDWYKVSEIMEKINTNNKPKDLNSAIWLSFWLLMEWKLSLTLRLKELTKNDN